MGLETWKADENREDTDIVLLRTEISMCFDKVRLRVEEVLLGCETYAAKKDGCKRLNRKPIDVSLRPMLDMARPSPIPDQRRAPG